MKKITLATVLLSLGMTTQAQDSYTNDQLVNNAGDVHGTARFVGMGGAMGALGADLSTINWNPGGIGMYRRSDVSFTAGAGWNKNGIDEQSTTNATFDQAGFVYSLNLDENYGLKYLNVAFGYQKKLDYNNGFYADNTNLRGFSQMSQLAELASYGLFTDNNLTGMALENGFLIPYDKDGNVVGNDKTLIHHFGNPFKGTSNYYTQHSSGYLGEFDINISGNVIDQFYWGLTLGFDNLKYRSWSDYYESSVLDIDKNVKGDYSLYNDHYTSGMGFSAKAGVIVRPFEESPFRVALAVETPTWYQLRKSTYFSLTDEVEPYKVPNWESYLEYSIRSPWKVRAGVGSTLGNFLAWDVDYEFAAYNKTTMGYPETYVNDPNSSVFNNTWDKEMNRNTNQFMKPTHNVRAGLEVKPLNCLALRAGYNYATSAYKKNIVLDQLLLDSYAMDYATNTSYMRMGDVHSVTAGLGWKGRYCYLDLAYKMKMQKADFYAFDAQADGGDGASLAPIKADLTRHQITATFGFKF